MLVKRCRVKSGEMGTHEGESVKVRCSYAPWNCLGGFFFFCTHLFKGVEECIEGYVAKGELTEG